MFSFVTLDHKIKKKMLVHLSLQRSFRFEMVKLSNVQVNKLIDVSKKVGSSHMSPVGLH